MGSANSRYLAPKVPGGLLSSTGKEFTGNEELFLQQMADLSYSTGDILYWNGTQIENLGIGTSGYVLTVSGGLPVWAAGGGSSGITIGTTSITGGSSGRILYDNSGKVGELSTTGSGNVVLATSPTLVTPTLGVATATSVNGLTISTSTGTLTIANSKTITFNNTTTFSGTDGKTVTFNNSLTFSGTDSTTMTFPSTSATIARTDASNTFTGHQTIEGVTSTGATGTGNLVFATSPSFTTPSLGVATATSINGLTISTSTGTLTVTNGKTLSISNSLTLAGTDSTTITFQGTDTYVGRATTDTLTNKTLTSTTNVLGGVTMTLGSDATGDLYYRNSSGYLTRLGIGTSTQVLTVSGGLPSWSSSSGGNSFTDTFTASGSITAGNAVYVLAAPAITYDTGGTVAWSSGTTQTNSYTVGSHTNPVLIVSIWTNGSTMSSAPTYNGVSMTLAKSFTSGTIYFFQYYLNSPATGANNLVINQTSSVQGGVRIESYYNAVYSSSNGTSTTGTSVSQSNSISQTSTIYTVLFAYNASGYPSFSAQTNFGTNSNTNQYSGVGPPPYIYGQYGDSGSVSSSTTVSATINASDLYAVMCIVLTSNTIGTGWVAATSASSTTTSSTFIGFANTSASSGGSLTVTIGGEYNGLSGLTPGSQYYLSNSTGAIATSAGSNTRKVGISLNSTTILITNNW